MTSFGAPVVAWHGDGDAAAPLVVLLHGAGRGETAPLERHLELVDDVAHGVSPALTTGSRHHSGWSCSRRWSW